MSWPGPIGPLAPLAEVDWRSVRIAVSEDLGWAPVEPAVRAAFRKAVDVLVEAGARVEEVHPAAPYPTELWNDVAVPEGFASEGPLLDRSGIDATSREIVEEGRAVTAQQYLDAQERRRAFTQVWESFLETYDVLLAPSMPLPAFSTDITGPTHIDGVPVDPFFDDWCVLALPANLAGLPACAVPTGLSPDGLPVGMQIIGPRWSDARVLSVAAAYERLAPWPELPGRRR
jgi:Asp-tRNA(Asn)/Glu-tRNA(Gln) amidotransferase A subunit family amidase